MSNSSHSPVVSTDDATIYLGDSLEVLASIPDASIDSIVTDPPYEIGFMGRAWDSTGIAYNVTLWAECLRVLKPGGHLLSFGATRSYHRMAVAIEDAGFEIRDSIHWTYGSGFPKSLNVGKALEAQAKTGSSSPKGQRKAAMGDAYVETPLAGTAGYGTTGNFSNPDTGNPGLTITDPTAATWSGWGTALKPSHEPIVVARKPLAGTVAQNVLAHGTGALNIDACRVGSETVSTHHAPKGSFAGGEPDRGSDTSTYATHSGRWPANTVLTHSAGCRATGETTEATPSRTGKKGGNAGTLGAFAGSTAHADGTWPGDPARPVFACVPGCPIAALDKQADGPSRFFTCTEWSDEWDQVPFIYQAKPAKKERNAGLTGLPEKQGTGDWPQALDPGATRGSLPQSNFHPTVKPVALMRHLVRLVAPAGGKVLDPFLGSGTTAVAVILEGCHIVGVELTDEYLPIIEARVAHAVANKPAPVEDLFTNTEQQ